ncbi:MAG TPA: peptide chain release factor N(5)-glutamine methyltransferase [Sedimentisphaerales bacterium]|nr:peptide chain release factor N(5)-glutamine methyltransferase [Sedimentisphaerales bacterium]HRS13230.1 peptide chain release factor N(5)-glutamine methyltransferase [Sedimentisphaerales bacterium]HRV49816.1 peptide chain release factor N(5)-glutamine methyltransferase [Sedimentisphaerales bacterium]
MTPWTIQKLLTWITEYLTKNEVDAPRLSAEMLLSHVLGLKRIELYTQFDRVVAKDALDQLHDLVKRAGLHEPVAYLIGRTEFYSLEMEVSADCLIPRPETELLVQRAIEFLRTREGEQHVCDLCTGCGCIAIAIARNHANARVVATDISDKALAVAARNVEKHGLQERVELLCGDLFDPLVPHLDVTQWDLIVCNPPYVSAAEYEALDKNVKDYEPQTALLAGEDGLDVYRRIVEKIDRFLKPDGALLLEIGYAQGPAVRELLDRTALFSSITVEKDNQNNDRIVIARRATRAQDNPPAGESV